MVAIGKRGRNIPAQQALEYITGYGVGIDITARDLQRKAKKNGTPWSVAKGFDTFAPISSFVEAGRVNDPQALNLRLEVNQSMRQEDHTGLMIYPVAELISYLSEIFTLQPGDLIFTGTPKGVSAIKQGDQIKAILGDDLCSLSVTVENE